MPSPLFKEKLEVGIGEAELGAQKILAGYPPMARWLVIIGLLGFLPAYFIAKTAAYNYWTRNYQGQIVTAHPSFSNPDPPKLLNISLTTLGSTTYSVVATVQNPNLDLSVKNFSYSFQFFDDQKNPVLPLSGSVSGQSYFLPNQKQYLIVPNFTAGQKISSVSLNIDEDLKWQKRLDIPVVKLITSIPNFYQQFDPVAFVVEGNFQNNSPYQIQDVKINFLAYDANGKIVAVSQRDEYSLKPFERRAYKQLWPNISGQNVSRVDVVAQTNVFSPNNLAVPAVAPGSASDLSRPAAGNPSGY